MAGGRIMRYKNYTDKIHEVLLRHKAEIDKLVMLHKAEIQAFNDELEQMQGKYTQEYIAEFKSEWKPKGNYADGIKKSSHKTLAEIEDYADRIKQELDKYFDSPIRNEFANKINSISLTGMQLKDREFKLLSESASNYMEMRLVQHLAESRTAQQTKTTLNDNGYTEIKEITVSNPYDVALPDVDTIYNEFSQFINSAKNMARCYAGDKAELKQYMEDGVSEFFILSADAYFRNKALDKFTDVMEQANAILPEHKEKRTLTEEDKMLIDAIIDPAYPSLAGAKVKEIAQYNAELKDILALDERYAKYLDD